jgi:hypothetical protein
MFIVNILFVDAVYYGSTISPNHIPVYVIVLAK